MVLLGSSDFVSQSPLGPSGRTRSKQKTIKEFVEREREGQDLFPSSLFYVCHCPVTSLVNGPLGSSDFVS